MEETLSIEGLGSGWLAVEGERFVSNFGHSPLHNSAIDMSAKQRSDDDIIVLLQEASGHMKTAKFEDALSVFNNILAEENPNVTKFAASVQGMVGECLFSVGRMPYVHFASKALLDLLSVLENVTF